MTRGGICLVGEKRGKNGGNGDKKAPDSQGQRANYAGERRSELKNLPSFEQKARTD